ncbi:MAG TPA: amidohydrolase family protein [bacterium]|uniref:N-acetylglucosamine-6-phosphate deacetylase n=1 Tax=candidate division TA06 bacterium ADurb.Bin417 TaxID=1852828 RepID=A0A1V5MGX0_UNCT6|nr:MAG: N-acetylglucosamine-6-phosphate deacetylase [candidate division TA06 bacterium ADurb.Bin417]HNQ34522.1 amidohydrolase family protein [bacterium]HNS48032.1 amidohydrolase family protein [bacterium]
MEKGELSIRNGRCLLADGRLAATDLRLSGGRIAEIGSGLKSGRELDAAGGLLLPGLVDLHTHGLEFALAETAGLDEYARLEAARGVTAFCPTFFNAPENLLETLRRHCRETGRLQAVPQAVGFRLESPYLTRTGGGRSDDLVPITTGLTDALLEAGGGLIKVWDIAPELEGAVELIGRLSSRGIVCSLGHTNAGLETAAAAVEAGARLVTHLFNVMPPPDPAEPGLTPVGLADYFLVEPRLWAEIIPDGTHVAPILVREALRCKGPDRLIFITDSNCGAGLAPGDYLFPNRWGRVRIGGSEAGVRLIDRDLVLAGSALTALDAFRAAVNRFGQDLAAASRLCSTNPARLLGLNKGEIAPGRDADLVILDDRLDLICTVAAGRVVYERAPAAGIA